jgi:hypothetical protein
VLARFLRWLVLTQAGATRAWLPNVWKERVAATGWPHSDCDCAAGVTFLHPTRCVQQAVMERSEAVGDMGDRASSLKSNMQDFLADVRQLGGKK